MRTRHALVLLWLSPLVAHAQHVSGIVRATGTATPMGDVTISVLDSVGATIAQTQTDASGHYNLALQPDGKRIRATHVGYRPVTLAIPPGSGDAVVDVILDVLRELDTVVSKAPGDYKSPRLQEFNKRRLSGMGGRFISDEELRKHDGRALADVIRTYVPGVTLIADRSQLHLASMSAPFMNASQPARAGGPKGCWVTVYLDGVMIFQGAPAPESGRGQPIPPEEPPDLKQFFAINLSGVEYYSSAMTPVEFKNMRNPCGTLLLWTRGK